MPTEHRRQPICPPSVQSGAWALATYLRAARGGIAARCSARWPCKPAVGPVPARCSARWPCKPAVGAEHPRAALHAGRAERAARSTRALRCTLAVQNERRGAPAAEALRATRPHGPVCDAPPVDPLAIGLVVLTLVAGGASIVAVRRGGELGRLRNLTGASTDSELEPRVRALRDRVTELEQQAEADARDLDHLVELVGVGIVHLTDRLVVDAANSAAHHFLRRAPGTMRDRPALEAFVDARIEAVAGAAFGVGAASAEVKMVDADGPTLLVRARRSPVSGGWLVLEDVSELRRLQQIRAEFIDNLSHELRTPLTTISLLAETLTRDAEAAGDAVPARMRDRIGKIEIETGHLVQMVNELMDLTRIESGRAVLLLDDVAMGTLATSSVERLRLFAERQGVRLAVDIPPVVPAVRGEEDRLGQVIVNLLHNAVKFSPNGGSVTVRVRVEGAELVTSVEDHGIGIPRNSLGRIFERFYKADRARVRSGGGTGLGLAIARHVVQQHGGRIWVDSREGRGSTFSFALPIPSPAAPTPIVDEGPTEQPAVDAPPAEP
jgi:signal transduction histidine kinase